MGMTYLVIIATSIIIGVTLKTLMKDFRRFILLHLVFLLIMVNVTLIIDAEFAPMGWGSDIAFFYFFLPVIVAFVSGGVYLQSGREETITIREPCGMKVALKSFRCFFEELRLE